MTPVTNNLQRTMYFTGSYLQPLNKSEQFYVEPSAVIRMMFNAPMTFDLNLRLLHESGLWGGVSYRFKDAIALMIGFSNNKLGISYSYDINTSALNSYNSGSHEVTLTYKARNKKGNKEFNGGKYRVINCPTF
jgi:type IX secretion system PorP/SprF family membrane protein